MEVIKLIYAVCVFLVGLGLAATNMILYYKIEKEYSGWVTFGSIVIIIFFCLACETILFR